MGVDFDGHTALQAFDAEIAAGEALAVVGPSGAGKTTVLRLLNGSRRATRGRVSIDGSEIEGLSYKELRGVRSRIGFVHQELALVPNLRVVQNVIAGKLGEISFPGALRAMLWPRAADVERAHAILQRVGIPEKLYQRTDSLSGGERQRVAIARALFQEPSALLADEPVAAMDPARSRDILELLTGISREDGLTLILSMHDIELARDTLPRLVGLRAGRKLFDSPTSAVSSSDLEALYRLAPEDRSEESAQDGP